MPVVTVEMWSGRTREQKARIIKGITDVFVSEGIPAEAVTVIIHDVDRENWGIGGKPSSEMKI